MFQYHKIIVKSEDTVAWCDECSEPVKGVIRLQHAWFCVDCLQSAIRELEEDIKSASSQD